MRSRINVLILGSGGREHALAWKIAQSPILDKLYIAPGNAGTRQSGENIALNPNDFEKVREFALQKDIHMVVVGPEEPLVRGIQDFFADDPLTNGIQVVGPSLKGAMLEGSKDFAKQFMKKYNIPTAAYESFDKEHFAEAVEFLKKMEPPYVLKADGLAAGKGVVICGNLEEAIQELEDMLVHEKFGTASFRVVIEQFLRGIEVSTFALTDGEHYLLLPEAKDYKRIGENDSGPNTGGMGSVSPVPFADREFMQKVEDRIIRPTVEGLKAEGICYQGFVFAGLMNVNGEPYVIEYNARLGDPETESILPRIRTDLLEVFQSLQNGGLNDLKLDIDSRTAATVMMVSGGYPGSYAKGYRISFPEDSTGSVIFHAGTQAVEGTEEVLTAGGRVLAVTSMGDSMEEALEKSYLTASRIDFQDSFFRKDIGFDLKK